jgi:TonB family protein
MVASDDGTRTANDRFKRRFGQTLGASVVSATALHLLLLVFFPTMTAADLRGTSEVYEAIEVVPSAEIPPPPEDIARPAIPIVNPDLSVEVDATIPPSTFGENPPTELPPPPVERAGDAPPGDRWTPFEVRPELRNRDEYARGLARRYPGVLRNAGIGGTVLLWVQIDEHGLVRRTEVVESSGYPQLDRIAEEVMREVARFRPALNRDQAVTVWVQIPVVFETR